MRFRWRFRFLQHSSSCFGLPEGILQSYYVNVNAVTRVISAPNYKVNVFQWRDTVVEMDDGDPPCNSYFVEEEKS